VPTCTPVSRPEGDAHLRSPPQRRTGALPRLRESAWSRDSMNVNHSTKKTTTRTNRSLRHFKKPTCKKSFRRSKNFAKNNQVPAPSTPTLSILCTQLRTHLFSQHVDACSFSWFHKRRNHIQKTIILEDLANRLPQ
jgi:hypothetical protein